MKTVFQAEVAGRAADLDLVIAGFSHPAGFRRVEAGERALIERDADGLFFAGLQENLLEAFQPVLRARQAWIFSWT